MQLYGYELTERPACRVMSIGSPAASTMHVFFCNVRRGSRLCDAVVLSPENTVSNAQDVEQARAKGLEAGDGVELVTADVTKGAECAPPAS